MPPKIHRCPHALRPVPSRPVRHHKLPYHSVDIRRRFLTAVKASFVGLPDEEHAQSAQSGSTSGKFVDTDREFALQPWTKKSSVPRDFSGEVLNWGFI